MKSTVPFVYSDVQKSTSKYSKYYTVNFQKFKISVVYKLNWELGTGLSIRNCTTSDKKVLPIPIQVLTRLNIA